MDVAEGERERAWARQWATAAEALAAERLKALSTLSEDEAAAAVLALLDLAATLPPPPESRASGLIEQQAQFHGLPRP